jgi:hypothetical protein
MSRELRGHISRGGLRDELKLLNGQLDASGDLLVVQEAADGIAGLRAAAHPILDALDLKLNFRGLLQRIISAYDLNETAVARAALIDYHDAVKGFLGLPDSCQTYSEHAMSSKT